MIENDESADLADVTEDYKECSREELYKAIRMWRSYAIQWQDWADQQLKLMGYKPPELVSHGRLGTQEQITKLIRQTPAPSVNPDNEP